MKPRLALVSLINILGLMVSPFVASPLLAGYQFTTLASTSTFNNPGSVAVDSQGNVFVVEGGDNIVTKITTEGVVSNVAGLSASPGYVDATGTNARFFFPQSLAVDSTGNIYVADTGNNAIRKITPSGVVTTLAGAADGSTGSSDGVGAAASFYLPYGLAVDAADNVYVADTFNHTIRKITSAGLVTTIAGSAGNSGNLDDNSGTGTAARFSKPRGIAVDGAGNLYIADSANHSIRKITSGGVVVTLAGSNAGAFGLVDGTGTAARFTFPHGVSVDSVGNVYVADTSNNAIRKITSSGVVTTFAGAAAPGSGDGSQSVARFRGPDGVTVDSIGNVYVADTVNNTIRKGFNRNPMDINYDGHTDLLWRNVSSGVLALWFMNGVSPQSTQVIASGISSDWQIAGTGDFSHDGQIDLLWRQVSTGTVAVWFMNGTAIQSTAIVANNVTSDWQIAGTGDFNQDGQTDILWRRAYTGAVSLWTMSGATIQSVSTFGNIPADWIVGGTGDFDGDGHTDILWRQLGTGKVAYWLMKGTTVQTTPVVGVITLDWVITGVGDFNDDGKSDILWRNSATGVVGIWYMNGTSILSTAVVSTTSTDWAICN